MERSFVFAGFGGQGILFAGQVLARAAIKDGLETFWIPSYGPEMRGGTASCTVIVGDAEIGSPVVDRYDAAIVMNPPSLAKFAPRVADGGLLVVNGSLVAEPCPVAGLDELRLDCSALAHAAGDDKLVSVVALGAAVARSGVVSPGSVRQAIREVVGAKRPEVLDADLAAFDAGSSAVAVPIAG
ncbi:MAG TPA: 2-oxoacid:acceptor oxidoreductase family protein [Candidatus Limnocylindrales bacterium]|nr:2-oxoacid:acceptor oxidoreductase family protein [Candidatus Limnocylindrales bacterium]